MDEKERTLTDKDVEAIAVALQQRLIEDFYNDLGKGVFAWFLRGFFVVVIGLAAYGAALEWHK